MKESFVLYTSQYEAITELTKAQKGELFEALFHYVMSDEVPTFSCPEIKMAFNFMRLQIDRDTKKYEGIVAKRKAAGRRGGRAKANAKQAKQEQADEANVANAKQAKQEQADEANVANANFAKHNDNVNDNDNDNDNH